MEQIIKQIQEGLLEGDAQVVKNLTEKALAVGINAKIIIKEGLMPGMKIVGQKFRDNEIFIPDVLMSSRAMHASLYVLRPLLTSCRLAFKGSVVVGTVAGDLHDIGKNMVAMMLEGAGYSVIDAGIDVPAGDFVKAVKKYKPDILAMSALLTTTMGELGDVIARLKEEGLRHHTKVLVGGGPVTPEFALAIEADAYAADSYHAIEAANRLITGEVGFISVS
ncbi:cobalamin B12-binding domain-containing protein [Thermincola ferriacetica]|uniref:Cobalamin B12-binding domain-containing protein n=1 Tax=Thermincola ferriacetica TaxID=281456 RepID=A0A0L6W2J0_9FIRM|nr:corrinoid protein [Thermincola ferriacetica]KNZ69755.1 cobalamin B12-binding domain-containing protein [Thermincola ferriacetica]